MSLKEKLQKIRNEDSPFFKAEVLKEYKFELVSHRELDKQDRLYDPDKTILEFTLIDLESNREKKWTTSSGDVFNEFIEQEIEEGDRFSVIKTGETGQGKKYWKIKKLPHALDKSDEEMGELNDVETQDSN